MQLRGLVSVNHPDTPRPPGQEPFGTSLYHLYLPLGSEKAEEMGDHSILTRFIVSLQCLQRNPDELERSGGKG